MAPPNPQTKPLIVVALYDYEARDEYELSFGKGDHMKIVDDSEGHWFKVLHLTTKEYGYVPENFVAPEKSVETKDWYFRVTRREAEELLLNQTTSRGTFLVRPSEHNEGYTVSVKDWENGRGFHVQHYMVHLLENHHLYISINTIFMTLSALVSYYSKNANGLCHALTIPCKKIQPGTKDLSYAYMQKWEIDRDELTLIKHLGRGNSGDVYCGKWKNTIKVAVKTYREGEMTIDTILEGAAIMKQIRHDKLVKLYGVCTKEVPIYIVQEYMCNGSVWEYLKTDAGQILEFKDLLYIAYQTASGMEYLESKKVVHRDLAARNVLLGENLVAKICDFGLARIMVDNEYCSKSKGLKFSYLSTAPEALIHQKFTIKSDVWSFGIFLMELFTFGQRPYPGIPNVELMDLLMSGYRMPQPKEHVPDSLYGLMLKCWKAKPEERPNFKYLVHYFELDEVSKEIYEVPILKLDNITITSEAPVVNEDKNYEISRDDLVLTRRLGRGNFGEVYYGKWKNNIEVAVKTLKEGTMSNDAFLEEAAIMKKFRHEKLVAIYGICSEREPIYIVQEYMNNGNLLDFLRKDEGKNLVFGDLIYIAFQVASGMEYLESKQLIHRDLAARNVLIGENNIAKICDFGLARVIKEKEYCSKPGTQFPVKWTAPEANNYGKCSIKSDVWSYGILLMELFTYGQVPYPAIPNREVIDLVNKGYRMPKPTTHHVSDEIYQIMLNCWNVKPQKRPTFEFLFHYFEGLNWKISKDELVLIRKLGRGTFGEVYYGKWKNNIEVAVKTLREDTIMSTAAFLEEAAIMKKFRHKKLVALYGICSEQKPIYIVQEYMNKGSLLDFLRKPEGKNLVVEDLIYIAFQVASGMEYLESKQFIHRDLAARNVLIGENNIAKICDFGLARVIKDKEYCAKQATQIPVKWTAPEALNYGMFSIKSDVWSYGILLMELFTSGQVPYPAMSIREVVDLIDKGYRMPKPTTHHVPDQIYQIMLNCWDANPEKRPSFESLTNYFEGFKVTSEVTYREEPDDTYIPWDSREVLDDTSWKQANQTEDTYVPWDYKEVPDDTYIPWNRPNKSCNIM